VSKKTLLLVQSLQLEIDRLTRELAERETQLASIRQLLEDAEARAAIPDGWVAVPVEPTERMIQACGSRSVVPCYKAMLSTRPELPKDSNHE
jgi:hypothetical protein